MMIDPFDVLVVLALITLAILFLLGRAFVKFSKTVIRAYKRRNMTSDDLIEEAWYTSHRAKWGN